MLTTILKRVDIKVNTCNSISIWYYKRFCHYWHYYTI